MAFVPGSQIGPYQILEQLGQGGMATVYKAYHPALDRYVALKALHPAFLEDPNFLARFRREARVVAKLDHPNIVPVYDYSEHEGRPYLVMKFIEGETLKARLRRGPLGREAIMAVAEAVGAALTYAHQQGVLHRDIKPSNVLLAEDGRIYLADFGLARIAQAGESTLSTDRLLGTPQYISPEQALGKRDLDVRTDIYSFGVMLYEMFLGQVPYSADTPYAIIHDHIYSPLPRPREIDPSLPPALERVLLKALAKDPDDRFDDVPSLMRALRQAVAEADAQPTATAATVAPAAPPPALDVTVPPAPAAPQPAPPAPPPETPSTMTVAAQPRAVWPWFVGGALAVVLVLGLVWVAFMQGRRTARMPAEEGATMPTAQPAGNVTPMLAVAPPDEQTVPSEEGFPAGEPPLDAREALAQVPEDAWEHENLQTFREAVLEHPDDPDRWFQLAQGLCSQGYLAWPVLEYGAQLASQRGDWELLIRASDGCAATGWPLPQAWLMMQAFLIAPREELQNHIEDFNMTVFFASLEDDFPRYLPYDKLAQLSPELAGVVHGRWAYFRGEPEEGDRYFMPVRKQYADSPLVWLVDAERTFFAEADTEKAQRLLERILDHADDVPDWVVMEAENDRHLFQQGAP